jgi:hypothetical protein
MATVFMRLPSFGWEPVRDAGRRRLEAHPWLPAATNRTAAILTEFDEDFGGKVKSKSWIDNRWGLPGRCGAVCSPSMFVHGQNLIRQNLYQVLNHLE